MLRPGWHHCFADLLMTGFQHNLLCHICSSSFHLSFFPGSSPLIWLCLFSFFHCFNASCQIECLWDSFLDFRGLKGLFFFFSPSTPPPLFSLLKLLFFISLFPFFFSWDSRLVFPISLLAQSFTSNFLCVLMVEARSSCGKKEEGHMPPNRFLCSPVWHWNAWRSSSPQGFTGLSCAVISSHIWHSGFKCQVEAHQSQKFPSATPTVSPAFVRPEHKNEAATQQEWPT